MKRVLVIILFTLYSDVSFSQSHCNDRYALLDTFLSNKRNIRLLQIDKAVSDTIYVIDPQIFLEKYSLFTNRAGYIVLIQHSTTLNTSPSYLRDIENWSNHILLRSVTKKGYIYFIKGYCKAAQNTEIMVKYRKRRGKFIEIKREEGSY